MKYILFVIVTLGKPDIDPRITPYQMQAPFTRTEEGARYGTSEECQKISMKVKDSFCGVSR